MSATEIFTAGPDGELHNTHDFRNAWRGAMSLWTYLGETRLGWEHLPLFSAESMRPLWNLADDPDLPEHLRLALVTTFDSVVVPRKHMRVVGEALRKAGEELRAAGKLTHLHMQGELLLSLLGEPDEGAQPVHYVAWNQTNVNADVWRYCGAPYDTEDGEPTRRAWRLGDDLGWNLLVKGDPSNDAPTGWDLRKVSKPERLPAALAAEAPNAR